MADRDATTRERILQLDGIIDVEGITRVWEDGLAAPRWVGPPLWLHGDLHPANIIVDDGVITAIVDWGDVTSGDPATDLSVAWMLFDESPRRRFRAVARIDGSEVDEGTWRRARAWAVSLAVACLVHSADNPTMARIGHATLAEVLGGP